MLQREESSVLDKRWLVLIVALCFWVAVFYIFDRLIMAGQGLPVGIDLLPV